MKSLRKNFLALLVVCMLVSITAACSNNGDNGGKNEGIEPTNSPSTNKGETDPKEERPLYTIKYMGGSDKIKRSDETEIGQIIKEKFNIVFEFIPYAGNWEEKVNLMLAGGDYPEILRIEYNPSLQKYIQAGAALALDEYLPDSPNFSKRYAEQIPLWRSISADKKLYNWQTGQSDFKNNVRGLDIGTRIDVLEKQGYPNLVSEDEWINYLKQAMKDFPKTASGQKTIGMAVPFGEPWGMAGIAGIMYEKGGRYTGVAGNGAVIFDHANNQFVDYLKNEYVVESLKFFNKLYREGILDKEAFTDKYDQYIEKLNSGRALSGWYALWGLSGVNQALIKAGQPEQQYIVLPVRSNTQVERNEKRLIMELDLVPFNNTIITKNAKDPKRIMELLDWASTDEGQTLIQSGIKDKHYTVDAQGIRVPTELFTTESLNADSKVGIGLFSFLGLDARTGEDGQAFNVGSNPDYVDKLSQTAETMNAFEKLGWKTSVDYWEKTAVGAKSGIVPSIKMDPNSPLIQTEQKMVEFRVKNSAKLMMAKDDAEFSKIWDDVIKEYDKLNPDDVINEYNKLYQEASAELNK
ncbi:extracellular solute-binding protein [Paenibacillus nasutitermitis]|uniref:Extracellular solute-binding protein n=1 Tax=Paenibacillus nasutitermitis TaxID=1652958 RepID=A0A916ZHK1_9BACL|nr:extracellular solute-binding protein [Paenibacillus nasutitermitis]GGD98351.1 hypothetical protein GCM10010911_66440 [Paenibacillus nasutitermitis]